MGRTERLPDFTRGSTRASRCRRPRARLPAGVCAGGAVRCCCDACGKPREPHCSRSLTREREMELRRSLAPTARGSGPEVVEPGWRSRAAAWDAFAGWGRKYFRPCSSGAPCCPDNARRTVARPRSVVRAVRSLSGLLRSCPRGPDSPRRAPQRGRGTRARAARRASWCPRIALRVLLLAGSGLRCTPSGGCTR